MKMIRWALWAMAITLLSGTALATAAETRVQWHGHAAFSITAPDGTVLFIDPWLSNSANPAAADGADPLEAIDRADYILVTHGHFDHLGETVALARKTGARLIANYELGQNLIKLHDFPADQAGFDTLMGAGGELTLADGAIRVLMTPAIHSSGLHNPRAGANEPSEVYGGSPGGFVITIADGPTIYHTGDTDFFKELYTLGHCRCITLALMNIGGHFGMEPAMAAYAAKAVRAKYTVAHHYGTFPMLTQTPEPFRTALKRHPWYSLRRTPTFIDLEPGGVLVFDGHKRIR